LPIITPQSDSKGVLTTGGSESAPSKALSQEESVCSAEDTSYKDPADMLTDQLAFDVAASDPSFITAGLTNNWKAFRFFRSGLNHWNSYEPQQNPKELGEAIKCYREAIREDRKFVLANYRLGLALQRDGKPESAIRAFQESVTSNPDFIPAMSLQAVTLYNLRTYYPYSPAISPSKATVTTRRDEATKIWSTIAELPDNAISLSERRSAYYGLCLAELDIRAESADPPDQKRLYLPYFYCSRAEALFFRLPIPGTRDIQEKNLEAAVLNVLGVALEYHRQRVRSVDVRKFPNSWNCSANAIDPDLLKPNGSIVWFKLWGSPLSKAALNYYRESLAVVPSDPVVHCNEANAAAYVYEDMRPMQYFARDPSAHTALGSALVENANRAAHANDGELRPPADPGLPTGYYNRALFEFEAAIQLSPASFDALNGYSYGAWQWALDGLEGRASSKPHKEILSKAESYARAAVNIAHAQGLHNDEMNAQDTLGEILIAQGRLNEAVNKLDFVEGNNVRWDGQNETRWDYAQAMICSGNKSKDQAQKRRLLAKAFQELALVRVSEENQEFRPFTESHEAFDPLTRTLMCFPAPEEEGKAESYQFTTHRAIYSAGPGCAWASVVAKVLSSTPLERQYIFHVWGDGINERVPVEQGKELSIQLKAPLKARHGYYYAQLEDSQKQAASGVQSFDTFEESKASGCSKNWITIVFQPHL
jgi:tetratricopeptide (TPR) repeat protein